MVQVLATKVAFSTLEYVINNSFTLFPRCSWTLLCSSRTNNQNLSWKCTSLSAWLKWKYTTLLWYACLDYSDSTTPNPTTQDIAVLYTLPIGCRFHYIGILVTMKSEEHKLWVCIVNCSWSNQSLLKHRISKFLVSQLLSCCFA